MLKNDKLKSEENEKIIDVVEKILEFDRQKQGQDLKILTPNQMLSRLPITLAQLNAGNNSEKTVKQVNHTNLNWI